MNKAGNNGNAPQRTLSKTEDISVYILFAWPVFPHILPLRVGGFFFFNLLQLLCGNEALFSLSFSQFPIVVVVN